MFDEWRLASFNEITLRRTERRPNACRLSGSFRESIDPITKHKPKKKID